MKHKIYYLLLALTMLASSCKLDMVNPNAASDQQVLNTSAGIIALSIGIRQSYSTTGLSNIMVAPCVTAREIKGVATFTNVIELEQGGSNISTPNATVLAYWSSMQAVMAMCESVINNAPKVSGLDAGTLSGVMAQAYLFKAMSLAELAMAWEQADVYTSTTAPVQFVARDQVFVKAISLLDSAVAEITTRAGAL